MNLSYFLWNLFAFIVEHKYVYVLGSSWARLWGKKVLRGCNLYVNLLQKFFYNPPGSPYGM